ncbi:MAG: class I SAM-dependent methyltransferase [Atopobiaceae bacterium]|nr:class I SAM-dependent methyltransferase [Atopobiaceae bacterium]
MNTTIAYFDENAERCFADAFTITERSNQDRFLAELPADGSILDLGCGSGRDTAYFREKGFRVTPTDGSARMCTLTSDYLGTPVRVQEFNELTDESLYDGIFASASIMHLEYDRLTELMPKIARALKPGGVLYVSFKYGDQDGYLGKRYYTYMTEERFEALVAPVHELEIQQMGTFGNEHPGQPDFRWLWALLRKRG